MARSLNNASLGQLTPTASGANSLITVTGKDGFDKGDWVFLDYGTSEIVNMKTGSMYLALGADTRADFEGHPFKTGTVTAGSAHVVFPDGSYAVFVMTLAASGNRLLGFKYGPTGPVMISRSYPVNSGTPTRFCMTATLLTDGNVAFTFLDGVDNMYCCVVDSNLAEINPPRLITNSFAASTVATSDGGLLICAIPGIFKVAPKGASVSTVVTLGGAVWSSEIMTNGNLSNARYTCTSTAYNSLFEAFEFFSISGGGFGLILANQTTGAHTLHKFNSDGSIRSAATVFTTVATAWRLICAIGVNNNIFWLSNTASGANWGIISETGTVVKAATAIAGSDACTETTLLRNACAVTDANGDFFFTWGSSGGTILSTNWVSGTTGVPKAGFPRTDTIALSNPEGSVRLAKLSTGVVQFLAITSPYITKYSFFNNAGTLLVDKQQVFVGTGSGHSNLSVLGLAVANDNLYGYMTANVSSFTGNVSQIALKITNTGAITLSPVGFTQFNSVQFAELDANQLPIVYADSNYVIAFSGTTISRFKAGNLQHINTRKVVAQTLAGDFSNRFVVGKAGKKYILTHSSASAGLSTSGGGYPLPAWGLKPETTVLLGIAQTSSAPGEPVVVQTSGHANHSWIAEGPTASGAFDQSNNFDTATGMTRGMLGPRGSFGPQYINLEWPSVA